MLPDVSHEKGKIGTKIVLGLVFLIMIGSLALSDVTGLINGGLGNGTVATINGERITTLTLQREMQRVASRINVPQDQAQSPQFAEEVLRIMIAEKLNAQGARKMKLNFSDAQVAAEIKKVLDSPLADKKMDVKTRYDMMLRNSGLSEKEFIETVRASLAQRLTDDALEAAKLPDPLWARIEAARKEERRDVLFVNIPLDEASVKTGKEADDWAKKFYNDNQSMFMQPEARSGRAFVITKDALTKAGGEDTQNYLMEIEDAFAGGDDIDAVVKQYNLETRKATNAELTGDLEEDVVSSAIPQENGDAIFVVAEDITPAQPQPFDTVKKDLIDLYRKQTAMENAQKAAITLKAAANPASMVNDMKGVETFSRESVAYSDDVADVFETAETNKLIELKSLENGDLRFAIIRSITPGNMAPYKAQKASDKDFSDAQSEDGNLYADQILSAWYDQSDIKINDSLLKKFGRPAQTDESL